MYDEELLNTSEYPDGSKRPYFTISYANGPGYHNHYVANGNGGAPPWRDPRDLDFEDADFTHPSMMPGPDVSESHGGEDVSVYATGTNIHVKLITIKSRTYHKLLSIQVRWHTS